MAKRPRSTAAGPAVVAPEAPSAPVAGGAPEPAAVQPELERQDDEAPAGPPAPGSAWLRWIPWVGALLLAAGLAVAPAPQFASVAMGAWVALALTAAALAAGALGPRRATEHAGIAAGILAILTARLAIAAAPAELSCGEPLRTSIAGLDPLVWAALAAAGLAAMTARPASAQQPGATARQVAGLGALGMALWAWMPAGYAAEVILPAVAALGTVPMGPAVGAAPVPVGVAGAVWLLVAAALSVAVLAGLVLRRDWTALLAGSAALGLAIPAIGAASMHGVGAALAAVGALTVAGGIGAALADEWTRPQSSARRLWLGVEPWAVAVLISIWLLLKTNGLRYSTTDEALYYYAAKLWSEGQWPYRDFFFSHPPLHIAVPALLYKVLGYHFLIGKWLSALAALVAGLLTWRMARCWLGPLGGLLALALHLLACESLQASTNLTGVNLTVAWMMAGWWAALHHRRFLLGGALLGAAASTGFYAIGGFLAAVVMALTLPWPKGKGIFLPWWNHPAVRTAVGFAAVWGAINLFFWQLGGERYLDGVYEYHFAKKAKIEGYMALGDSPFAVLNNFFLMLGAKDWKVSVYYHAAHWWLALGLPLAVAARLRLQGDSWVALVDPRQWWQRAPALLVWATTWALVLEFGSFKERYDFYFALILPGVSLVAAAFLAESAEVAKLLLAGERRALAWAAVLAAFGLAWMNVDMAANRGAYPSEMRGAKQDGKGPGERLQFEWLPAPGPAWVSEWTRALLWQDYRIRGSVETGVHHYLWSKKRWFSTAEAAADYIRANSRPDDTITGASDYAPLLALLSGRRMAGNHVDTNSKVFNTGAVRLDQFWDEACRDKLKFIVAAPQSYFAQNDLAKRLTIVENFQRDKQFADPKLKHWKTLDYELWVRKSAELCTYRGKRGVGPSLDSSTAAPPNPGAAR